MWNGIAVCMSPAPTPLHQYVASTLAYEIRDQLRRNERCKGLVVPEIDWRIDRNTVVRPDVLIICSGLPEKYLNYAPSFIAEVLSPSTAHKDRTAKRELYEQQHVKWYFIVDTDAEAIVVLELVNGVYVERSTSPGEIAVDIDPDCHVTVQLERIFGRR